MTFTTSLQMALILTCKCMWNYIESPRHRASTPMSPQPRATRENPRCRLPHTNCPTATAAGLCRSVGRHATKGPTNLRRVSHSPSPVRVGIFRDPETWIPKFPNSTIMKVSYRSYIEIPNLFQVIWECSFTSRKSRVSRKLKSPETLVSPPRPFMGPIFFPRPN